MNKKLTTEQFIGRAMAVHGNRYDYSRSVYVSFRKPITIICPVHGEFTQLPSNHLKGSGCLRCSHDKKKSKTDDFIERCKEVHDNKFDYSRTVLNGIDQKVTIICPVHGEFEQRAASHLNGNGCLKCAGVEKSNTNLFIKRANEKHRNKYTYNNVDYINSRTKVSITCPDHGEFKQTPSDYLQGYGCPECGGVKLVTKEVFVERARKVHSNRYDYTSLVVEGMNTKGMITCPIHGEFKQRLADHVNGAGCPECSKENMGVYTQHFFEENPTVQEQPARFYVVEGNVGDTTFCKVGITKQEVKQRFWMKGIKVRRCFETTLYKAWLAEQHILSQFRSARFKIQPLRKTNFIGWTECFSLRLMDNICAEADRTFRE